MRRAFTPSAFNTSTASIDQSTVASVTAQAGAEAGTHTLTVSSLAASQRVLGQSFSDPSVPLNITGSFDINGKVITLSSTNTLSDLVANINGANAGVQASVVTSGTGSYQLSLNAHATGTLNSISATDLTGTALESLGLIPSSGQTTTIRQAVTSSGGLTGAGSIAFTNSTQPIGTLNSAAAGTAASGTVKINGTSVALNLNTMSLSDVANAINSAGITGVQAQIVSIPDASGNIGPLSPKQLQIVSTSSGSPLTASSFTDSGGVLASLGITQAGFANQVSAASDAKFAIDGVSYTRSSNTVNDALQSVSINLLATNSSSTSTPANISITQDTSAITTTINNFVTAYNGVVDYINGQQAFSPQAQAQTVGQQQQTPPLFGDFTLSDIQSQLSNLLGATSGSTTLASVGITVNSTGDLTVDPNALQTALQTNGSAVAGLFGLSGSATSTGVQFVTASVKTQASTVTGYPVNITQAAAQGVLTASNAFQTTTAPETLSFSGSLFGTTTKLTLPTGTTIQGAIDLINGNSNLNQYLYASQDSTGHLVISTKGYGSNQSFSVASNLNGAGTSGIGSQTQTVTGKDVAGTIDGELAIGNGQTLIGSAGNKNTDGLQLLVTGTTTGPMGSVSVSHGIADQLNALVANVTDPTSGSITTAENAINSQISDVQTQIADMQTQLTNYQTNLQTEFNNMEIAISQLQSQGSALTAVLNGNSSSSSSSSSSSKSLTAG